MQGALPRPGGDFHRLLRLGRGSLWRLVLSVVVAAVGLLVMSLVAAIGVLVTWRLLLHSDVSFDVTDGIDAAELLALNLGLALQIPVAAGLMSGLYRVSPRWLASNRPGMRWMWLAICVGIAATVWSPLLVLGSLGAYLSRQSPLDSSVLAFMAVLLFTTPLQAAGEEYLFRGLLLQGLGATGLSTWACCGASGALFALAHLQLQPALFADRFLLGTVLAWLAIRTGGLEAGIAVHAVKNLAVLVPAGLLDQVGDALDPTGVTWLPLVVDVVLLSFAVPWMVTLAARRHQKVDPSP